MAIGEEIVSAYHGPADLKSFDLLDHELSMNQAIQSNIEQSELEKYYLQIREYREGTNTTISRNKVFKEIVEKHPKDWLLSVELYELAMENNDQDFAKEIKSHLHGIKLDNPKVGQLIDDGISLVETSFSLKS